MSAGAGPEVSCERRVGESGARAPSKKDELAQLEARKEMLEASGFAPGVSVRAPGMSMGASAEPSAPKKKKKKKQKRHPCLPSQEGQEYYKSYLVHL